MNGYNNVTREGLHKKFVSYSLNNQICLIRMAKGGYPKKNNEDSENGPIIGREGCVRSLQKK